MRRDIRKGKVSATKDESGNIIVDTAELQRVYGQLTLPEVQETDTDSDKIVSLLEEQVAELRQALEQSTEREQELLDLLKNEQNRTLALSAPVDETDTDDPLTQSYEERIQELKTQLEKAEQRENTLIEERNAEQQLALMPPPTQETTEPTPPELNGHRNWWDRLTGRSSD